MTLLKTKRIERPWRCQLCGKDVSDDGRGRALARHVAFYCAQAGHAEKAIALQYLPKSEPSNENVEIEKQNE